MCSGRFHIAGMILRGVRTIYNGRAYGRFYRGWGFRGLYFEYLCSWLLLWPGFYGWAYNPWRMPISFGWGWGRQSVVRVLRRVLPALSGVSFGGVLADGLHDLERSAGGVCGAPGSRRSGWRPDCAGRAGATYAGCEAADCRRGSQSTGAGKRGGAAERARAGNGSGIKRDCADAGRRPAPRVCGGRAAGPGGRNGQEAE